MRIGRSHVLLAVVGLGVVAILASIGIRRPLAAMIHATRSNKTIADRVEQFGDTVRARLSPAFGRAGVAYPPKRLTLVGLKQEKALEVWVAGDDLRFVHLKTYPILAASGGPGPKLKEGDRQVPEGLYRIESLNPNSLYHLALRVNYPSPFDKAKAAAEGRTNLGGDIMIHGKSASVGCLAMGDEAAEDLFILAADTGIENIAVVLSPVDFRVRELPPDVPPAPPWTPELYDSIRAALSALPRAPM